jgi:hypothetical protein
MLTEPADPEPAPPADADYVGEWFEDDEAGGVCRYFTTDITAGVRVSGFQRFDGSITGRWVCLDAGDLELDADGTRDLVLALLAAADRL